MGWEIHLHIIAAVSWIGGSVFMFVLGISLRDKKDQEAVYPRIGPIFGYFEMGALIVLIVTGLLLIINNGLINILFSNIHNEVIDSLRTKLWMVLALTIVTIVHTVIAFKTNGQKRTLLQNLLSRGASMLIFVLNFLVLHYAIVIRDIL